MKATIDIPDDLYRRVKARTAGEGRRIREVAAELFRQWLDEGSTSGEGLQQGVPVVNPAHLRRYLDVESLRRAYPRGYRLSGPLLPAGGNAQIVPASLVERALADMDTEELMANDRTC